MCFKPQLRSPARSAFTLIELLVVVAIIAILLSILLPSLERARAQARQLLCLTNERSQGQAAQLYSGENNEFLPRGLQDFSDCNNICEYAMYATALMPALGYPNDPFDLWTYNRSSSNPCGSVRLPRGGNNNSQKFTRKVFKGTYGANFQCPDYPSGEHAPGNGQPGDTYPNAAQQLLQDQYLDYVASAMPTAYTQKNINYDQGDLQPPNGDTGFEAVRCGQTDYVGVSKISEIEGVRSPSDTVYITEAHVSLQWDDYRFHHFFLASQLPFAGRPRIANDQRHPGGLNCLFFDGHAKTLPLKSIDPGWPNSLGLRLRWFATPPPEYF